MTSENGEPTDPRLPRTALLLLRASFIVNVLGFGLRWSGTVLSHTLGSNAEERLSLGISLVVVVLCVLGAVSLATALPRRGAVVAWAVAVLSAASFVLHAALERGHRPVGILPPALWWIFPLAVLVMEWASLVALWLALVALARRRALRPLSDVTKGVFALLATGAFVQLGTMSLIWTSSGTGRAKSLVVGVYMAIAVFFAYTGAFVWLTTRLLASKALTAEAAELDVSAAEPNDVLVGSLWLLGGLAATAVSYAYAAELGGRFLVTIGAIVYGVRRLLRGLSRR